MGQLALQKSWLGWAGLQVVLPAALLLLLLLACWWLPWKRERVDGTGTGLELRALASRNSIQAPEGWECESWGRAPFPIPGAPAPIGCGPLLPLPPSLGLLGRWAGAAEFRLCMSLRYAGHACFVARVIFDSTAGVMSRKRSALAWCCKDILHECVYCAPPT